MAAVGGLSLVQLQWNQGASDANRASGVNKA